METSEIQDLAGRIRTEVAKAVIGQRDTVDLMLTALFSAGHILLEGPPGTAKTLLTQCFAAAIDLDFGRIQFTPDLMPGDVIGTLGESGQATGPHLHLEVLRGGVAVDPQAEEGLVLADDLKLPAVNP